MADKKDGRCICKGVIVCVVVVGGVVWCPVDSSPPTAQSSLILRPISPHSRTGAEGGNRCSPNLRGGV